MKKQWSCADLIKEGRIIESGAIAASELGQKDSGRPGINRTKRGQQNKPKSRFLCFKCEERGCLGFDKCEYKDKICPTCNTRGHSKKSRFCKGSKKPTTGNNKGNKGNKKKKANRTEAVSSDSSSVDSSSDEDEDDDNRSINAVTNHLKILSIEVVESPDSHNITVSSNTNMETRDPSPIQSTNPGSRGFPARRIGGQRRKPNTRRKRTDFHTCVTISDSPVSILVDTGADVNVMSKVTANKLGLTWKRDRTKLKPYGSKSLKVCGVFKGPISFGDNSTDTEIFIVRQPLESLMSGITAEELGIITFHAVNLIEEEDEDISPSDETSESLPVSDDPIINSYIAKFHKRFKDIGKCEKVITLHEGEKSKPVIQPQRPIPFHLRKKFDNMCDEMIRQGIFEEVEGPNEWISNPVIVPKGEDNIRITVDYRNLNKSLLNSHHPIPRIDDLRAFMNGCQYFSKLDLRQAYFQFPICEESKKLTTFYANGRLLRLTRLP